MFLPNITHSERKENDKRERREREGDRSQESKRGMVPTPLVGREENKKKCQGGKASFLKKFGEWEGIFRILSTAIKLDAVL